MRKGLVGLSQVNSEHHSMLQPFHSNWQKELNFQGLLVNLLIRQSGFKGHEAICNLFSTSFSRSKGKAR